MLEAKAFKHESTRSIRWPVFTENPVVQSLILSADPGLLRRFY